MNDADEEYIDDAFADDDSNEQEEQKTNTHLNMAMQANRRIQNDLVDKEVE